MQFILNVLKVNLFVILLCEKFILYFKDPQNSNDRLFPKIFKNSKKGELNHLSQVISLLKYFTIQANISNSF